MDSEDEAQQQIVKTLEEKLNELRKQRMKVDEANDCLKKKLATLSAHLNDLDEKYGKQTTNSKAENENPGDT